MTREYPKVIVQNREEIQITSCSILVVTISFVFLIHFLVIDYAHSPSISMTIKAKPKRIVCNSFEPVTLFVFVLGLLTHKFWRKY